jgi:hypothetical protein
MTPNFDELVGTDMEPAERARLEQVHDLLVAAGPPPVLTAAEPVDLRPRRPRTRMLAIAAALAVGAFALGATLVGGGRSADFVVPMDATAAAPGASASLAVFDVDEAGNWPLELDVEGLPPSASGLPYELWLTRNGALEALCGGFLTEADGSALVPMNAPYEFSDFDGWVVVEENSETPLLTT